MPESSAPAGAGPAAAPVPETLVHRFEEGWLQGRRPAIEPLLDGLDGDRRGALLVKLLHAELEFRLRAGEPARAEEYLRRFPELAADCRLVLGLLAAEYDLRRRTEPGLSLDEYGRRFPELADELQALLRAPATTISGHTDYAGPSRAAVDFLAPPQAADELGRLGSYRILNVLGQGGMGIVFLAEDPHLQRKVAIKAMKPTLAVSESARTRFLREAKTTASMKHDHIVTIHQVAEDRGVPFLVMELLAGESLEEYVARVGQCSLGETLRIGKGIALGLAAAHQKGLIHRDIKPANIWLEGPERRVKILDFGLARVGDHEEQLTQTGVIVGTPAYMSPEQARGETIDQRSDLFSLGCVLYRLCTGERPFKGKDRIGTLMAVANEMPKTPCELDADVPRSLSQYVMKLLTKEKSERPISADQIVEHLDSIERLANTQPNSSGAAEPPQGHSASLHRTRAVRNKWPRYLGGSLALGLSVVATYLVAHWLLGDNPQANVGSAQRKGQKPPATKGRYVTSQLAMQFAWIPPGSFRMGSPRGELGRFVGETQHKVTLTKGFYMGTHLVTRGQFTTFVEKAGFTTEADRAGGAGILTDKGWILRPGANWRNPGFEQTNDHPATCVSWNDALAFAKWLSKEEGKAFRLPTEAEWEYACRAGTTTAFHFGDAISAELANYQEHRRKTTPVGMFPANAFGLHDMHGNVWEWCHDWIADYPEGDVIDPKGPDKGTHRAQRGASWGSGAVFCRAACRWGNSPDFRASDTGFRLCFSVE
jgi:formylglycine-generating enzyme required for sulfatase activity/tRNA A-37 threonylcarbamoyl transferase component Bud32